MLSMDLLAHNRHTKIPGWPLTKVSTDHACNQYESRCKHTCKRDQVLSVTRTALARGYLAVFGTFGTGGTGHVSSDSSCVPIIPCVPKLIGTASPLSDDSSSLQTNLIDDTRVLPHVTWRGEHHLQRQCVLLAKRFCLGRN